MRIVTPEEMVRIDRWAIEDMGIPDILLMELAGKGTADIILTKFPGAFYWLVVAGKGNNGGDGYVVARHLVNNGIEVDVIVLGEESKIKGSARKNLDIIRQMGVPVEFVSEEDDLSFLYTFLDNYDGIVDAIFGTGFKGSPKGVYRKAIEIINTFPGYVVSLDIPSGVDGRTGQVEDIAVHSDVTCAICMAKTGHFLFPGRKYRGELYVVDIGVPLHRYSGINKIVPTDALVNLLLPIRPPDGHKGTFGKVMVIGGSSGMAGAVSITALSALKVGCGLSYAAVPRSILHSVDSIAPEVVKIPLEEDGEGRVSYRALPRIKEYLGGVDVVVVGPGMRVGEEQRKVVMEVLDGYDGILILDADALNNLAGEWDVLKRGNIIMTPHPGEYGRWKKISAEEVNLNRLDLSLEFLEKYKDNVLILKGAPTMVAGNGTLYINPTGNDGMATGGSGDVLAGVIAGLVAQGLTPVQSAFVGAFIHGKAGDIAAAEKNRYSITAVDIMEKLADAITDILKSETE